MFSLKKIKYGSLEFTFFTAATSEAHCSTMNEVRGYSDERYERQESLRAMNGLSPGSCMSDSSVHSNPGITYLT